MSVIFEKRMICTDGRSMQEILKDFVKPVTEDERKPRHWMKDYFPEVKKYEINLLDFDEKVKHKNVPLYIFPVEYHDKALSWWGNHGINQQIDKAISAYFSDLCFEVTTTVEIDIVEHYLLHKGRIIKDFLER